MTPLDNLLITDIGGGSAELSSTYIAYSGCKSVLFYSYYLLLVLYSRERTNPGQVASAVVVKSCGH